MLPVRGDPAAWRETEEGWQKVSALDGTINTFLLVNDSLSEGALARAVVTMTEAKTTAVIRVVGCPQFVFEGFCDRPRH